MKVTLIFKGAQPFLYKGNNTVKHLEEVEFDEAEAATRLKIQPGMWERRIKEEVEPIVEEEVVTKKSPAKKK